MPFEIFKSKKNRKFYFRLKAKNGKVILQSQGYESKAGVKNGIQSIVKHSREEACFERKLATDGQSYFNLKATNGLIIGKSESYQSIDAMENGIQSVINNASVNVVIKDLSG